MPHALAARTRTPFFALFSLFFGFAVCPTPAEFLSLLPRPCSGLSSPCAHPVGVRLPSHPAPSERVFLFRVFRFFVG